MSYEETFEHKGFKIVLRPDEYADSPAQSCDMMERFLVGFHRDFTVHYAGKSDGRYDDDAPVIRKPEDVARYISKEAIIQQLQEDGLAFEEEAKEQAEDLYEPGWVVLPLQAYIHGGVHLSLGSFGCPWDSGQVGWVFVKEKSAWGMDKDGMPVTHEKIAQWLVDEWNSYLSGDIWFVSILDSDGDLVESLGQIVGMENALESAKTEIVDPMADDTKEVSVKILHEWGSWTKWTGAVPVCVGDSKAPEWLIENGPEIFKRGVNDVVLDNNKPAKESVA